METLTLTKRDLALILVAAAIVPLISFLIGFAAGGGPATAEPSENARNDAVETAPSLAAAQTAQEIILAADESMIGNLVDPAMEESPGVLTPELPDPDALPGETRYIVQAGVFREIGYAEKLLENLTGQHIRAWIISSEQNGAPCHRVIVGAYDSATDAKAHLNELADSYAIPLYMTTLDWHDELAAFALTANNKS